MLKSFMQAAEEGRTVWIGDLREAFAGEDTSTLVRLRLTGTDGTVREVALPVPDWQSEEERALVLEYVSAFVFNLLSCFGGRELCFVIPEDDSRLCALLRALDRVFELNETARHGYGKVISICDRLSRAFGGGAFRFRTEIRTNSEAIPRQETVGDGLEETLRTLTREAGNKFCCGIDVGGTDIKAAVSCGGKLLFTKEFDWDPSAFSTAMEIREPILLIARLLRLSVVCPEDRRFLAAVSKEAPLQQIRETVAQLEEEHAEALLLFDSIGLSFPDVVIHDRILGGETPKTSGLRRNPAVNYEEEFARLGKLREDLQSLCVQNGAVRIANDGSVAAFTAAVELAAAGEALHGGVFAHSLGTDLGTGWLNEAGELPPMPLEMYDFLLDLGSRPQRRFPPEDVRSVRNENSGLPDARKYLGQSAAFRIAEETAPSLLDGYTEERGGMLVIQSFPEDRRKACLAHLMECVEAGDQNAAEVFRRIGFDLGQISREIQFLLHPATGKRFLYGRFVKHPACFEQLRKGFSEVMPQLELIPADSDLACSPLMKQLSALPDVTVAQFGQAVGSIYFGLS